MFFIKWNIPTFTKIYVYVCDIKRSLAPLEYEK